MTNPLSITWKVITDLGVQEDTTTLSGQDMTLQGINTALDGNYVLGADIDAIGTSSWNSSTGWTPLGNNTTNFTGKFDGLGHTIDRLFINNSSDFSIGLFGIISNSTIKNIGLTNLNITGTKYEFQGMMSVTGVNIGGIVGENTSNSTVSNSYSAGSVTGSLYGGYVGGLVGKNNSTVTNSYSTATVTGGTYSSVGGFVGYNSSGSTISNSFSSGSVIGTQAYVGGLVGSNYGSLNTAYYDKDTNTVSMSDTENYGKTKAEILTAFSGKPGWVTSGASVEGYATNTIALPQLLTFFTPTATLFESGFGTSASPYTITNWTQLQNINNSNILTQNYYFSLLNNLTNETTGYTDQASSTANSGKGWNPIGSNSTNDISSRFKGTFDGNNHTIDSLNINNTTDTYIGLFGYTNSATISNLGVTNVNITSTASSSNVGAIVGTNDSSSTVSNSYSSGSVAGGNQTYVGGLVGRNNGSTVSNSYSTASAAGGDSSWVGGLVGGNISSSTISNSYSIGSVTGGTNTALGGLVGRRNSSTVNNSYYDSTVNSTGMGDTYGKTTTELKTPSTFSAWSSDIWSFTSSGGGNTVAGYDIGGAVYPYLKNVTAVADRPTSSETVLLFEGGYGTSESPYTITNWTQLQNINNSNILTQNYYFSLANNLTNETTGYTTQVKDGETLANSGKGWNPIGNSSTNKFTGTFDGNNHIIDSLNINNTTDTYIGLFGYTNSATISNLGVTNVNISGTYDSAIVGAIIGNTESTTISNTYSTGSVTGGVNSAVGGLVAYNDTGSSISNSYATSSATGGNGAWVGGLVGGNDATISNSYSTGSVSSVSGQSAAYLGGIIGYNSGTVSNSFYNTTTSGQTTGIGGLNASQTGVTGLTTAQFANSANFLTGNESTTWSNTIWSFGGGVSVEGYEISLRPYLKDVTADADKPETTTLFEAGLGTSDSPYTIINWTQLQNINNSNVLTQNYYYSLLNDLNSEISGYTTQVKNGETLANSGKGWNPIGTQSNGFAGIFNGGNHIIDGLTIHTDSNYAQGLFGYVYAGTVKNLGLTNVNIYGINGIGSVVGYNGVNSLISNVYATGAVYGSFADLGGLVGNNSGGTIENTYSAVTVNSTLNGAMYIGGLVGRNVGGTISNSYSIGNIVLLTGNTYVGGLIGKNSNTSTLTAIVNNSFYDKTLLVDMTDAELYGKTTSEMQNIATYTTNIENVDARWNMTTSSEISSSYLYPILVTTDGETSWKIYYVAPVVNTPVVVKPKPVEPQTPVVVTPEPQPEPQTPVVVTPEPQPEPETPVVVTPEPEKPTQPENPIIVEIENKVKDLITSIINTTTIQAPKISNNSLLLNSFQTNNSLIINNSSLTSFSILNNFIINPLINVNLENSLIVTSPMENQPSILISINDLKFNQNTNISNGNSDIKIPVGNSSILFMVNDGVLLPDGLSQSIFIVNN